MENSRVGLHLAPQFLKRDRQGKAGPGPTFQAEFGGPPALKFTVSRRLVQVVGWMLFGVIIAGPNLSPLHSQDSRHAPAYNAKAKESVAKRARTPANESSLSSPSSKAVQPEIILPDIYIAVPARAAKSSEASDPASASVAPRDTTTLKQKLQKAESELRTLRNEHSRLMKDMEQFKTRPIKGANRPVGQQRELLERPSG
jgi:hypothetical protein